ARARLRRLARAVHLALDRLSARALAGSMEARPGRAGRSTMKRTALALILVALLIPAGLAAAADDTKVKSATNEVETGAKKIGQGKVGDGVEETAKGIGHT